MNVDRYGQLIFSESDLLNAYMTDPERIIKNALVNTNIIFDESLSLQKLPTLHQYVDPEETVAAFDTKKQNTWHLPKEYMDMDIAKWVLDQCKNNEELQRAGQELLEFQKRDMFVLLKYLKYLVDTMRKNNIIWGVGRGSSVASFVLYLIGIHKINSLYYDLSIEEFLK